MESKGDKTENFNDLSDEFLKLIKDRKLNPPLNNYSAFIHGSEYNTIKYYGKWYGNKVILDYLILIKEGFSQIWMPETDLWFASEYALKEYITHPKKFEKRIKVLYENINKIDKIYKKYSYSKIEKTNWGELIKLVDEIRDLIWDANAAVIFTIYLDKDLCWNILDDL